MIFVWFADFCINSSPHSVAYMRHWIGLSLVQILACRLFAAKPLSIAMLGYCQLNPWGQTSVKNTHFHSIKCTWTHRVRNCGHFVLGGDEINLRSEEILCDKRCALSSYSLMACILPTVVFYYVVFCLLFVCLFFVCFYNDSANDLPFSSSIFVRVNDGNKCNKHPTCSAPMTPQSIFNNTFLKNSILPFVEKFSQSLLML